MRLLDELALSLRTRQLPERFRELPARLTTTFTRSDMDVLDLGTLIVARAAKRKIVEDSRVVLRHEGDSVVALVSRWRARHPVRDGGS